MAAYLIVHRSEITNSETLKAYRQGINETIAKFGGKVAVRADGFEVLEGNWRPGQKHVDSLPGRITVLEFPDMGALKAWYDSDEYARLKTIRQSSATSDVVAVQGL